MQTIRQQTAMRSPLVRTAERQLNTPRLPKKSRQPRPLSFMVDGTACTDEVLRFPRTSREAFGSEYSQLGNRITFLPRQRAGWIGLLAAITILAAFALAGA